MDEPVFNSRDLTLSLEDFAEQFLAPARQEIKKAIRAELARLRRQKAIRDSRASTVVRPAR